MKSTQLLLISLTSYLITLRHGALAQDSYLQLATEFITTYPSPYGSTAFNSIAFGAQRYAMACLYYATYAQTNTYISEDSDIMDGWYSADNWISEEGVCEWEGVQCNDNNFVIEVDLSGNNLGGTFPNEFSVIGSSLEYLDLSNNPTASFMSGMFWMGQMTQLLHLDIHNTNFDHSGIPPYFANLVNLQYFDMSETYIWYSFGWDVFSNMTSLEWLNIADNYYEGEFPTEIANLPNLKNLYIHDSYFSGSFDFLDTMTPEMIEIWADQNYWEPGPIPSALFQFSNLKGLSLTGCQLTGTIPTEFGLLDKLERVWLFNNTLSATIPTEIGDMDNLKLFQMEDNMLTGSMPASVCDNFDTEDHPLKALASDCESEVDCPCCNCCASECDCNGDGCYQDGEDEELPPSTGGGFGCFSGVNTVNVAGKGMVPIRDLKIGDDVQVGSNNKYSRVYSFGHYNKDMIGEYLKFYSTALDRPLEISKDHMIFVENRGIVPASTVTIGEKLVLATNNDEQQQQSNNAATAKVTRIDEVYSKGAFAPFTESGTISVNGVISSNYITMQDDLDALTIAGGIQLASMHWIAHSFQIPHRLACKWNFEHFCAKETYSESGISKWVYGPYLASKWFLNQHVTVLSVFSLPVILVAFLCNIINVVTTNYGFAVMVGILGFIIFSRKTSKKL
mmetsp:Transcript_41280/g.46915  ORF Transcript_41280/g.46915 Transcript_41280/m.46915 type:complete len:676 (-) Transcript_41280:180-2207(-)|eukprot:CAMPEP_0194146036 /NCGR_PEP_ID=MMETSP0152-20130528/19309_1 /TAXON_ID=1049557 /ORGANISM="Thalassiothrix antarctica, Strain L6-D1" /LENGTH=675 /DNA_ID=CAMNT_0038846435 /DNA_START=91 /DNA_END=2118 /DNA_ORIENTATION=+